MVREGASRSASGQSNLGVMYKNGHGVDVNYKQPFEWLEKAAEQEYAHAQCNLGLVRSMRGRGEL